jgi:hypothetical protein
VEPGRITGWVRWAREEIIRGFCKEFVIVLGVALMIRYGGSLLFGRETATLYAGISLVICAIGRLRAIRRWLGPLLLCSAASWLEETGHRADLEAAGRTWLIHSESKVRMIGDE